MPEGPECHHTAYKLNAALRGKTVTNVRIVSGRYEAHGPPKGFVDLQAAVKSASVTVLGVQAKGKLVYFTLSNDTVILSTLGLSGAWTKTYSKHCGIALEARGPPITYWFRDQLHYGTFSVINRSDLPRKLATLGPDVTLGAPITDLPNLCRRHPEWDVSKLLMNQSKVSGIGNYLKAEILYAARICPHAKLKELSEKQLVELGTKMVEIPAATFRAKRRIGPYVTLKVYNKSRDPQGNKVIKTKTGDGRNSHWVPAIQDPTDVYTSAAPKTKRQPKAK